MSVAESAPILVVDDDAQTRFLLESVLADYGYPVLTARDGREALHAIEHQLPALVLLDLKMPVLSGWETLQVIRERPWSFPIVFLSGGINAAVQAAAHRADGYLTKPFDPERALETVESFVAPPTTATQKAVVAIVGFGVQVTERFVLSTEAAGFATLVASSEEAGATPTALRRFLHRHQVAVLLYNICPPYLEHWALFAAVRSSERETGAGRRFIALTTDKASLQTQVGPTPAIALDAEYLDQMTLPQSLREAAR